MATNNQQHHDNDDKPNETVKEISRAGVALSTSEVVGRYGSANAEFIKGYTGVDNEVGKILSKGLKGISKEKTGFEHRAGWSAEVAATSRDNAETIIAKSDVRTIRSDDLKHYGIETDGKYREAVDRVRVQDGEIVYEAQTKFEKSGNKVTNQVSHEDHKYSKYFGKKLELPSEQVEEAKQYCRNRAENLRRRALKLDQEGNAERAQKFRTRAEKFDQLVENDIVDTGLTREQAGAYATKPRWETAKDIARTSHRAGMEGAKYGAIIGGSISLLSNIFAIAQDEKRLDEAAKDVLLDTGKGVIVGYATAATGAALKGAMQQSSKEALRTLSKTNVATLTLNVCISLGSSIHCYVNNEITDAELLEDVGEKGAGMLSSGMYAALGQLVIPIPFVGAAVGGMIGYTLSSMFYQSALNAAKQADAAKANLARVREIEAAAREEIDRQRAALDEFMRKEFPELLRETEQLFAHIDAHGAGDVDTFAAAINRYAELLGAQLQFKNQMEFDRFMVSDEPLRL